MSKVLTIVVVCLVVADVATSCRKLSGSRYFQRYQYFRGHWYVKYYRMANGEANKTSVFCVNIAAHSVVAMFQDAIHHYNTKSKTSTYTVIGYIDYKARLVGAEVTDNSNEFQVLVLETDHTTYAFIQVCSMKGRKLPKSHNNSYFILFRNSTHYDLKQVKYALKAANFTIDQFSKTSSEGCKYNEQRAFEYAKIRR